MNKYLEKISHNLLFHKKKRVYILRSHGSIIIYDENNRELKSYDTKEECAMLKRQLKLENLLDD